MAVNIDAVTVGMVAFISGIGQILAREFVDWIKQYRSHAKRLIDATKRKPGNGS